MVAVGSPCAGGVRKLTLSTVSLAAPAPLGTVEDADLARALIDHHPDAPRAVWTRFAPLVRRLVRRSLGPDPHVEDLVQEVFATLFSKPERLRDPAAFRGFI